MTWWNGDVSAFATDGSTDATAGATGYATGHAAVGCATEGIEPLEQQNERLMLLVPAIGLDL